MSYFNNVLALKRERGERGEERESERESFIKTFTDVFKDVTTIPDSPNKIYNQITGITLTACIISYLEASIHCRTESYDQA